MNVKLDPTNAVRAYSSAFRKMRELPGFDQAALLRSEAGVILKTWASRTKVTTVLQVERRTMASVGKNMGIAKAGGENPYGITINNGKRRGYAGRIWFRTESGKFQNAGLIGPDGSYTTSFFHFRNRDWQRINSGAMAYASQLRARTPKTIASRGLAIQSIIQIADALKIDLAGVQGGGSLSASKIALGRGAIASNGRFFQNGIGQSGNEGTKSFVNMFTRLPYGAKIGMDAELARILAGRAKYIELKYKLGAFNSIKNSAAAFPNLFNTAGLN